MGLSILSMFTKGVNMILGRRSFPLGIGYSRTSTRGADWCECHGKDLHQCHSKKIQNNYNIPGFMLDPFSCFAWKGVKNLIFQVSQVHPAWRGVTSHPQHSPMGYHSLQSISTWTKWIINFILKKLFSKILKLLFFMIYYDIVIRAAVKIFRL